MCFSEYIFFDIDVNKEVENLFKLVILIVVYCVFVCKCAQHVFCSLKFIICGMLLRLPLFTVFCRLVLSKCHAPESH